MSPILPPFCPSPHSSSQSMLCENDVNFKCTSLHTNAVTKYRKLSLFHLERKLQFPNNIFINQSPISFLRLRDEEASRKQSSLAVVRLWNNPGPSSPTLSFQEHITQSQILDHNAQTHTQRECRGSRNLSAHMSGDASFRWATLLHWPSSPARTEVTLTENTHSLPFIPHKDECYEITNMRVLCNLMYTGFCCQEPRTYCFSLTLKHLNMF